MRPPWLRLGFPNPNPKPNPNTNPIPNQVHLEAILGSFNRFCLYPNKLNRCFDWDIDGTRWSLTLTLALALALTLALASTLT